MDIFQAITGRRSVRAFQSQQIPSDTLRKILEAARVAPSARNLQQWKFVAVTEPTKIKELAATTGQNFVSTAPAIIAGVSLDPERIMTCEVPAYAVDLAIAMSNITLAATALGLGTCWIGKFHQQQAKRVLHIPSKYKVVQLMPIGYPADSPSPKVRKSFEEVVSFNSFA